MLDGELEAAVQALLNLEEMGITVEESAAADRLEQLGATQRWVAVEYVPTLDEAESVEQAIEDNFQANGILVVGLDGSAIGAWVAPGSAYPITLPSQLEIRQDWPLERVVRAVLNQSFS